MGSIKCGNCAGTHASVAEVRNCYTRALVTSITAVEYKPLPQQPAWATKHIAKGTQRYQGPKVVAMSIDEPSTPSPTGRITRSMPVMQNFPPARAAAPVEIPAGIYAIVDDEVKCYEIRYGKPGTKWDGFLFLERVSSDDRWPVKNKDAKAAILAAIRVDVEAAGILAAHTMGQCRRCGRTLTDTKNPYYPVGLGPDCGSK